ncbi:DUF4185 domain-containing protein [Mycolicibacterium diernhoferi]|uniref:DUF4185 domain-containing protein n=1 Tax=Mycolicibacterium diernhoferi TaxID=1801 RepID=A0A2A7NQQ2_9MYCO|nr:DUF4185 domain-containing protein [Mycolicibacterium diernhoferi]PEG52676.1 DUF4185 domain-containing protein [Mycolicibacterium diernhoferi]QYL22494.1 DUF4185 domain-containing protein [Mycolicibacterium diernhoferi]
MRVACAIASALALALSPPAHADLNLSPGQVVMLGPVAGTGTATGDYGIGATDLCEFMEFPSRLLQVCGDSFAGQGVGFGGWYSPVALHVDPDSITAPDGVRITGVSGTRAPLLAEPAPAGASQLPAGVVSINRENYMLVATTFNLAPASTRLVKADAAKENWPTVPGSQRPADFVGGGQSQVSGYYDPIPTPDSARGWVYIVADNFDRTAPVTLYRVAPQDFLDRAAWQGWSADAGWGHQPTPLWPDRVGEMSVRQIDGKTVLSYFNASTLNMEVRVANHPTQLGSAPVTTVVVGAPWPDRPTDLPAPYDNRLAQPYGGYISPASTLDELRVFVSQWNTTPRGGTPYRVIQYAVRPFHS